MTIPVLISGNFDAGQIERIRAAHSELQVIGEAGGYALEPPEGMDLTELTYPMVRPDVDVEEILRQCEVIIASRLPGDIFKRAPRLKWAQFLGAGVDHLLPREKLGECRFVVTNASGIHAIPMAETVLTMMLSFAKSWRVFERQQQERLWGRCILTELWGKTLGIIGPGRIGQEIARVGKAMGMRVLAVRRREVASGGIANVDELLPASRLLDLLGRSDYLVCSVPFTNDTYHMLGEAQFRAMKPTAYFVNVGRGQTVDERALIRALQEGWIAGAGLDVFEEEPLTEGSPLWGMPNVSITPHMASDTDRYMDRATDLVCENLRRYADGQPLLNVVDTGRGY